MDLNIYGSTTEALSFHVCIHLQHMECLEDHVYDEILELNTHILDTLPEEKVDHS